MKRFVTALLVVTIFALSLSTPIVYADEYALEEFSANLISSGKLLPVTTNMPSVVQPQAVNETLYDLIYLGLDNLESEISIRHLGLSLAKHQDVIDINETYGAVINENPVLFYIGETFSVKYNKASGLVTHIVPSYMENAQSLKEIFKQNVAQILSRTIKKGMSDEEILLCLHDYIVNTCEYNYGEQTMDDHTAYGIIVNSMGVCQGYALAYNYLLSLVGIETKFCISDAMNHGWSTVKLNGKWYHIDVTWDDPNYGSDELNSKGFVIHNYFLLSDETLENSGNHYDWVVDVQCTDKSYESGMPYNEDDTKHVDTNDGHHFTGFYPMYSFKYNEKDGLLYSQVEPDTLNVYFKTSFDGSDLDFITPAEYKAAVGLPDGVSAYDAINVTDERMTYASTSNMSHLYVTFENNTNDEKDGTMLIVLYGEDENFLSCQMESITLPASDATTVRITPTPVNGMKTAKILIWNTETLTEVLNTAVEF